MITANLGSSTAVYFSSTECMNRFKSGAFGITSTQAAKDAYTNCLKTAPRVPATNDPHTRPTAPGGQGGGDSSQRYSTEGGDVLTTPTSIDLAASTSTITDWVSQNSTYIAIGAAVLLGVWLLKR